MIPGRSSFHLAKVLIDIDLFSRLPGLVVFNGPLSPRVPTGLYQTVYGRCAHPAQLLGDLPRNLQLLPRPQSAHQLSHEGRKPLAADPVRNRPNTVQHCNP